MVSDDEFLERIVAGVQAVTAAKADVRWNEEINGRQFDVVVRFTLSGLRYLVLIEVKNRSRRTEASDVEAFVTKARDQQANKAVFVTRAGFQEGAITVAKRHGVDLFTVDFEEGAAALAQNGAYVTMTIGQKPPGEEPKLNLGSPRLISNITSIVVVYADGTRHALPSEASQMTYYVRKTNVGVGQYLRDVINEMLLPLVDIGETAVETKRFWPARKLLPPDDYFFPAGLLKSIELTVVGNMGRPIEGNTLVEPTAFSVPVRYTNVLTSEVMTFRLNELPLGDDCVAVGKFYFIQHPLIYYYCDAIEGDLVRWIIVESFQNGEIITAAMKQNVRFSRHYIPVRDEKILVRLRRRLENFRAGVPGSGGRPRQARS